MPPLTSTATRSIPRQAGALPESTGNRSAPSWWRALWPGRDTKVDEIRKLMLAQLAVVPDAARRLELSQAITGAPEPRTLWQLRGELTAALVEVHGELLARRRMTDITFMFAGLLERDRATPDHASAGGNWNYASAAQARMDH